MLDGAEQRLIGSPGLGVDELRRLQKCVVAIVGLGVLGGQLAFHLALLGVGLLLIDCARVRTINLGNQGFRRKAVGDRKGIARARDLSELNADVFLRVVAARIEDVAPGQLAGVDLIAVGLDSRTSRVRVGELASLLRLPWLNAAVDGSGRWLRGTVSLYDPRQADSPCYLCPYDRTDIEAIWRENRGVGCPSWRDPQVPKSPPTLQASAFASIVAGYQSLWAVRTLLGRGDELVGQQLVVDCDGVPRSRLVRLTRNQRCVSGHPIYPVPRIASGPAVGDLLAQARADLGCEADALCFDVGTLVKGLVCPSCRAERDLIRVATTCTDEDVRCGCSSEMVPRQMTRSLGFAEAASLASRAWTDLGVPVGELVTVTAGQRTALYIVNPRPAFSDWEASPQRTDA